MGNGTGPEGVREALWGKSNAFDPTAKFYVVLRDLLSLRSREPALRYGRQYLRPVSGNNSAFGVSPFPGGVLAFSRVLNDREIVIAVNPNTDMSVDVHVVVDNALNPEGKSYRLLYSNQPGATLPGAVARREGEEIAVFEIDGTVNRGGPVKSVRVQLKSMEIQIISQ